jgi:Ser/Thr protein kinase RdoA (MazF antagonist)
MRYMPYGDENSTTAPFSVEIAEKALRAACESANLNYSEYQPMRFGENALFHLPIPGVVVRIARGLNYWDDVVNEVNVARWLKESGIPAAEIYDVAQPIETQGRPVTFWRFIPGRAGTREDLSTLGTVLRHLHSLPRPTTFELPDENILGRVAGRIEVAPIPETDRRFLMRRFEELSDEVSSLAFPLAPAPTHGDAHSENLMIQDERPILIDFERFSWGQPEWDLAMTATEYLTAGWWTTEEYAAFCAAYGYDVTEWEDFHVLKAVHELKMTTWLMQNVTESTEIAREYRVRMETIQSGRRSSWRPF